MYASVATALVIPCLRTSSKVCSMQGFPATGTIGFGWLEVSGRRRVPSPPAITTAFTDRIFAGAHIWGTRGSRGGGQPAGASELWRLTSTFGSEKPKFAAASAGREALGLTSVRPLATLMAVPWKSAQLAALTLALA